MRLFRSTIVLVGFSAAVTLAVACGDAADDTVSPLDAGGTPDTSTPPPDTGVDATPIVDATTPDVTPADAADASDSSDASTDASDASLDAKVVDASDASLVDAKAVDASDASAIDASDASAIDASDGSLPEGGNICGGFCGIAKFCCTKITSVDYGKCVGTLGGCQ